MALAVIIPTLRRPEGLERAVRSVFAQTDVSDRLAVIVIVDNDPQGSAASVTARLAADAPFPVLYSHAPRPGVATASQLQGNGTHDSTGCPSNQRSLSSQHHAACRNVCIACSSDVASARARPCKLPSIRLVMPARTFPGPHSATCVTPVAAMALITSTHLTGLQA